MAADWNDDGMPDFLRASKDAPKGEGEPPQEPDPRVPASYQGMRAALNRYFRQPTTRLANMHAPAVEQSERPSEKTPVAETGPRKTFSMSRDDAIFWMGIAAFGDGLYLMAEHPIYATLLVVAGTTALAWAVRGHMPRPGLRFVALVALFLTTCAITGYDLYDRHFGVNAQGITPPAATPISPPQTSSTPSAAEPAYVKNIQFEWDSKVPLGLLAFAATSGEKLKIVLQNFQYTPSPQSNFWPLYSSIVLDEFGSIVEGQRIETKIVSFATSSTKDNEILVFGDPRQNPANDNYLVNPGLHLIRIFFLLGSSATPQNYKFAFIASRDPRERITVLPPNVLDNLEAWRRND